MVITTSVDGVHLKLNHAFPLSFSPPVVLYLHGNNDYIVPVESVRNLAVDTAKLGYAYSH